MMLIWFARIIGWYKLRYGSFVKDQSDMASGLLAN